MTDTSRITPVFVRFSTVFGSRPDSVKDIREFAVKLERTTSEKTRSISDLSFELDHCDDPVVYTRVVDRLCDIGLELAKAVVDKAGAPTPTKQGQPNHGQKGASLTQTYFQTKEFTIATRRVAIFIANGYDAAMHVFTTLKAAKAILFTIGPKRQPVFAQGESKDTSKSVQPDHHFEGMRSTMFDSIFVPGGSHINTLKKNGRVAHWVREAFGHLKAIGAPGEGVELVKMVCGIEDMEFSSAGSYDVLDSYAIFTVGATKVESCRESPKMMKGGKDFIEAYTFNISQHRNCQREEDRLAEMVAL
ncbi:MAG: hypothetical protein Q9187_007773 [Circinaria calcarea]